MKKAKLISTLLLSIFIVACEFNTNEEFLSTTFIIIDIDGAIIYDPEMYLDNDTRMNITRTFVDGKNKDNSFTLPAVPHSSRKIETADTAPRFEYIFGGYLFSQDVLEPTTFYVTYPDGVTDTAYVEYDKNAVARIGKIIYNGKVCERDTNAESHPFIFVR